MLLASLSLLLAPAAMAASLDPMTVGATGWVYDLNYVPTTVALLKATGVETPILYGVDAFDGTLDTCAANPGTVNPAMRLAGEFKSTGGFSKVLGSVSAFKTITEAPDVVANKIATCFKCGAGGSGLDGLVFDFEHTMRIDNPVTRAIVKEVAALCPEFYLTVQDFKPAQLTEYQQELGALPGFFGMVIGYDLGAAPQTVEEYSSTLTKYLEPLTTETAKGATLPFTIAVPITPTWGMLDFDQNADAFVQAWASAIESANLLKNDNYINANIYSFDQKTPYIPGVVSIANGIISQGPQPSPPTVSADARVHGTRGQ